MNQALISYNRYSRVWGALKSNTSLAQLSILQRRVENLAAGIGLYQLKID